MYGFSQKKTDLPNMLSAFEIVPILLLKAKRNDFLECSPVHDMMVALYKVVSFSLGQPYRNDLG